MKKSNLIGHNRPPRKHNYPKNRKPPKNSKGIVADKHTKWLKRMKRLDKTIERHRQKEEQRLEQKRIKDSKKKVKNRPRDITWISY